MVVIRLLGNSYAKRYIFFVLHKKRLRANEHLAMLWLPKKPVEKPPVEQTLIAYSKY